MDERKQTKLLKDVAQAIRRKKESDFQAALSRHLEAVREQLQARKHKMPDAITPNRLLPVYLG